MNLFKNLALIFLFSTTMLTGCTELSKDHDSAPQQDTTSEQKNNKQDPNEKNIINGKVEKVVDGDTISVQMNGEKETIRMLLIDTPETQHPNKPVQPYGPEASQFAKKMLSNQEIQIEIGTPKRDKYDRVLAYVYVNGEMYNKQVVRKGLARVAYVYPPNDKYVEELRKAEQNAKNHSRGIWKNPNYVQKDGFHPEVIEGNSNSEETDVKQSSTSLPYSPDGPDRDCGDFQKQEVAQAFFEAAGGPNNDPHQLDRDQDGVVCETLP